MFDYGKTVAAFYKWLKDNNISNMNNLPEEQRQIWIYLKNGQRIDLFLKLGSMEKNSKLSLVKNEEDSA